MAVAKVCVVLSILTTVAAVVHFDCQCNSREDGSDSSDFCSKITFTVCQRCLNLSCDSNESVVTLEFYYDDSSNTYLNPVENVNLLCQCCPSQCPTEQQCYVNATGLPNLEWLESCLSNYCSKLSS